MQTESSAWQQVSTGGIAQGDGDYRQLIASTAFRARWIVISWNGAPANCSATISAGPFVNPGFPNPGTAAGPDFFEGILLIGSTQGMGPNPMSFPCDIPAGTELGYQVRADITSSGVQMIVTLSDTPLGLDITKTQSSGYIGTPPASITIPAVNDTETTPPVEAIAVTNLTASWLELSVEFLHTQANNNVQIKIDIMTGAVGFEVPLINYFGQIFFGSSSLRNNSRYFGMPVDIPIGVRLSVRAEMLDTGIGSPHAEELQLGLVIFGV